MANRKVYVSKTIYPFYEEVSVNFEWFPGFATVQKQKSELSLHLNYLAAVSHNKAPEKSEMSEEQNYKILEISSKSRNDLGKKLSAMSLKKQTKSGLAYVESVFQSSAIYLDKKTSQQIGPFPEYQSIDGRTCKKTIKNLSEGMVRIGYEYDGIHFDISKGHPSLFYDYIYITSLLEEQNQPMVKALLDGKYIAFTDLATKSINTQARSAAIFVGMVYAGIITDVSKGAWSHNMFPSSLPPIPLEPVTKTISRDEVISRYNDENTPLS